jgi:hypothetical protein
VIPTSLQIQGLPGGKLRIHDPAGYLQHEFVFDSAGKLEARETTDFTQTPLERWSRTGDRGAVIETFAPPTRCLSQGRGDRLDIRCDGTLAPFSISSLQEEEPVCRRPGPTEALRNQVWDLLGHLENLEFADHGAVTDPQGHPGVDLGNNLVAMGCGDWAAHNPDLKDPGPPPHRSGIPGLTDDLQRILHRGLACLTDRSTPDSLGNSKLARVAAARLTAFLIPGYSRPVHVTCVPTDGHSAESYGGTITVTKGATAVAHGDCTHPTFPTIALRLDKSDNPDRPGPSVFHELLHIAGYPHTYGPDVAYLASACCFENDHGESADACRLMRDAPDWTTSAYLQPWMRFMAGYRGQLQVAVEQVVGLMQAKQGGLEAAHDALVAFANARPQSGDVSSGWPLLTLILDRATLETVAPANFDHAAGEHRALEQRFYPDGPDGHATPVLALARRLGVIAGKALAHGPTHDIDPLISGLGHDLETVCPTLSAGEREQLNRAAGYSLTWLWSDQSALLQREHVNIEHVCGP